MKGLEPILDVGFKTYFQADKIIGIVSIKTAAAKRLLKEARELGGYVYDATSNRACQSLIIMEGAVIIKSAIPRIQLYKRWLGNQVEEVQPVKKRGRNLKRKNETKDSGTGDQEGQEATTD